MALEADTEAVAVPPVDAVQTQTANADASKKTLSKHGLGVILILIVVAIWVSSSVLIQFIFLDSTTNFRSPLFLTYFNTTLFMIYLFGFLIFPSWRKPRSDSSMIAEPYDSIDSTSTSNNDVKTTERDLLISGVGDSTNVTDPDGAVSAIPIRKEDKLSWRQVVIIALKVCPLWMAANYCFNAGLVLTSVSSSTVLSTTSSLFTLLFGVVFRVEKFTFSKLVSTLLAFGGVGLVSISDTRTGNGEETLVGDFVSLIGACFYGLYCIALKRLCGNDDRVESPMVFGFIGLVNFITMWPFLIIWNYTGLESFEMPSTIVWGYLLLNGIVGTVISDMLWLRAILLTTPVIGTVGLAMTIPLAMMSDLLLHSSLFSLLYILGTISVIVGFVLVNIDSKKNRILATIDSWFEKNVLALCRCR